MTVSELILKLQALPGDLPVTIDDEERGEFEVENVFLMDTRTCESFDFPRGIVRVLIG